MDSQKIFLTQAELAERWRCSEGTIINYRKKGLLPYFRLPECSRIIYKIDDIICIEQQNSVQRGGDGKHQVKQVKQQKLEKPVVLANKNWRI